MQQISIAHNQLRPLEWLLVFCCDRYIVLPKTLDNFSKSNTNNRGFLAYLEIHIVFQHREALQCSRRWETEDISLQTPPPQPNKISLHF